jgi:DNA-binding LytR/AlgR family response regulator
MNAIAIDDEPLALEVIEKLCSSVDFISLQKTFTSPQEALIYLHKFPTDLLFLDIKMSAMNGLTLFKEVKQNTMVIFTTAYSQHAIDGFNLNAIDYLLKPIDPNRFKQAAEKALDYYKYIFIKDKAQEKNIFIRADYSLIKIPLSEILYVEGLADYLKIFTSERKPIVARMSMKAILEKLPPGEFMRVHRSYIVPLKNITEVRKKTIYLNDIRISIGSTYEEVFFKNYHQ